MYRPTRSGTSASTTSTSNSRNEFSGAGICIFIDPRLIKLEFGMILARVRSHTENYSCNGTLSSSPGALGLKLSKALKKRVIYFVRIIRLRSFPVDKPGFRGGFGGFFAISGRGSNK